MTRLRIGDTVRILPTPGMLADAYCAMFIGQVGIVQDVIGDWDEKGRRYFLHYVECPRVRAEDNWATCDFDDMKLISRPVKPRTGLRVGDWVRVLPTPWVRSGPDYAIGKVGRLVLIGGGWHIVRFPCWPDESLAVGREDLLRVHGDGSVRP